VQTRVRFQFSLDQAFKQFFLSPTKKTVEKRMRWAAVRRNGCRLYPPPDSHLTGVSCQKDLKGPIIMLLLNYGQ